MSLSWHDHPIKPSENTEYEKLSTEFPVLLKEGEHLEVFLSQNDFLHDLIDPRIGPIEGFLATRSLKIKAETANNTYFTEKLNKQIRKFVFKKHFMNKTKLKWLIYLI